MIKIAIADDHQLFRQGIISLLNTLTDYEIVFEAENGAQILDLLKFNPVDVILMDINMPEMDGITCAQEIKQTREQIKIIMLSMYSDQETIQKAIDAGIDGYLPKNTQKDELKNAIDTVMSGEQHFNESIVKTMFQGLVSKKTTTPIRLTPREKEILILICNEMTSQEIADKLFISFNTVETHRKNLLHKTGCNNSLGLLKFAMENKIFKSEGH